MQRIVFYAWQSDLSNATNRGFIQQALENAAAAITADDRVEIEPVIDRDTQGVAGSPDIASTIFAKITAADVFVADISIVGRPEHGRPTPNPNVLIELGYAFKALGHEKIILVFNQAFGRIEELPFDLRMRRVVTYNMAQENADRATGRTELESKLNAAVRAALEHAQPENTEQAAIPAVEAIENSRPNRLIILRRNLESLQLKINSLEPAKHSEGGTVEGLIDGISATQESLAEFSKISEIIALMNDQDAAVDVYHWFGKILEQYHHPPGRNGRVSNADCDYFKFVGHELFVTLIAFLLREQRWTLIRHLLDEPIYLHYLAYGRGPENVYWDYASEHLNFLLDESRKRQRISLHSDILHDRHTTGGLAAILPFEDFAAADFFLFLYGELPPETNQHDMEWRAWSSLWLKHTPSFIKNAERTQTSEQLAEVLKVPNVTELKRRLAERGPGVARLFRENDNQSFLNGDDIQRIGTR